MTLQRRIAASFIALTFPAAALAQATPAEAAGTPGCITKPEYRKLKKNMTQKRVQQIVGAKGKVESSSSFADGDAYKSISFKQCGRGAFGSASISLEKTEVTRYVPDVYCYDFDGDGYAEECEDYGSDETVYKNPMILTSKSVFWS